MVRISTEASSSSSQPQPFMNLMKRKAILSAAILGLSLSAWAATYDSGFQNSGLIPDDTTVWSDTHTVSGEQPYITSVSVTLNLSGGQNGDLYAYLSYGNTKLVLLNRVGTGTGENSTSNPTYTFGYSASGFSGLVLADGGPSGDIHAYGGGALSGTYTADGRNVSPVIQSAAQATALQGAPQQTFFGQFGGLNPNGDWTLSFADMTQNGLQSTVTGWTLSLETSSVPEPVNVALGIFAGLGLAVGAWRSRFWQRANRI